MEYLGVDKATNRKSPIVSVCIPTFQHGIFITECGDNVLGQRTNFTFEIVIGEDDSSDGTREICIEYADKFPDKVRLFLGDGSKKMMLYGRKSGRLNHLGLYGAGGG
jgi:glycosyltransferase involved in cell wall biosynthesis